MKIRPVPDTAFAPVPGTLMVSCMRNEGASVLEWFAFHRMIGFENFLIYTNNCQDGTDAIWERLTWLGLAVHRGNPEKDGIPQAPQKRAMHAITSDPIYTRSDWVLFLDADEFLNIKGGDGSLAYLLSMNGTSECICVNWRLFGTSGRERFEPGLITEQFTRAHDPRTAWNDGVVQAPKSIFRRSAFQQPGIHRPQPFIPEPEQVYTRPSGKVINRRWAVIVRKGEYSFAQINHYAVQSLESVMLKVHRGRGAKLDRRDPAEYLTALDRNDCEDTSIHRMLPMLRNELEKLLRDPVLNRLHHDAITWRQGQIRRMFEDPAVVAEFDALPRSIIPPPGTQDQDPPTKPKKVPRSTATAIADPDEQMADSPRP